MTYSVSVRTLAETYYEGGDLEGGSDSLERMQEGLAGHLLQQNTYTQDYRAEVPLKLNATVEGMDLCVQGRADGLMLKEGLAVVEEIKTTRLPPIFIHEDDYPVHWAQAQIYAHIVCVQNNLLNCNVRLVYLNLTGERISFEKTESAQTLEHLFYEYAAAYAKKLKKREDWLEVSLPSVKSGAFPFESFRAGQRTMAAAVYKSIKHKTKLLCEAPTGIGKTAAALFPAVKALGEGLTDTVFYLTARGTGRLSAENALKLMRQNGLFIRSVSIIASRKLCPTPNTRCDPKYCPRAKGHFDRQKLAMEEAWNESAFDEDAIRRLADKYMLCPFEFTLALCETAQVIICDYNYVFDPAVRLKRFFDRAGRYTLLIDEAHNLIDRAREMYSAEIGNTELSQLRTKVGKAEGKQCELYVALSDTLKSLGKADECELRTDLPIKTIDALKKLIDVSKPYLGKSPIYSDDLTEIYFNAGAFLRVSGEFDEDCYRLMLSPEGKRNRLKLWCWNPTPKIAKLLKRFYGTAMFSATLSPIEHYAALLSLNADNGDRTLILKSPFPRENLLSMKTDIPTRYSKRQESAPVVAKAIKALVQGKTGNYIACFPSYAYMRLIYEEFSAIAPEIEIIMQRPDMRESDRLEYLERFNQDAARSMVAFIAMGGVFSEGIDLPGDRLIGAAIVGVGLPQICFERDALKMLFDKDDAGDSAEGFNTAYVYPGIGKCLQAAGRVIRTASDKGAVLFIDERYMREDYDNLIPEHLKPQAVTPAQMPKLLKQFWQNK